MGSCENNCLEWVAFNMSNVINQSTGGWMYDDSCRPSLVASINVWSSITSYTWAHINSKERKNTLTFHCFFPPKKRHSRHRIIHLFFGPCHVVQVNRKQSHSSMLHACVLFPTLNSFLVHLLFLSFHNNHHEEWACEESHPFTARLGTLYYSSIKSIRRQPSNFRGTESLQHQQHQRTFPQQLPTRRFSNLSRLSNHLCSQWPVNPAMGKPVGLVWIYHCVNK